jgi:copper chaperone CopZ
MTEKLNLEIMGEQTMHCSGCERTVQFTLARVPGVRSVKANHKTQTIEIDLIPDQTDLEKVKAELEWIGYRVEPT